MPGYDGSGPQGRGPGTGWGMGPCMGARPRFGGRGFGRGYALGPGRGMRRRWYEAPAPYYETAWDGPGEEKNYLREQAEQLKAELAAMEQRLSELEEQ